MDILNEEEIIEESIQEPPKSRLIDTLEHVTVRIQQGDYLINKNGMPFDISPEGEYADDFNDITEWIKLNPDKVTYQEPYVPPAKTLEEVKAEKIKELNEKSSNDILKGFWYDGLHWSYDTFDQLNFESTFNGLSIYISQGLEIPTIMWNAYTDETHNTLVTQQLDGNSFTLLYSRGALLHKQTIMAYTGILKQQVFDATTIEEVESITWGNNENTTT